MSPNTIDEKKNQEIQLLAEKLLYYNELFIKQCDSWLPAEEGNANLMKEIRGREKETKMAKMTKMAGIAKIGKMKAGLRRFFGIDRILGKNI